MPRLLLPALLVLPFLAAGCGETTIDSGKAEAFVTKSAKAAGAKVKSASCPGGATAKKGEKITCTITGIDGSKDELVLVETDDEGTADATSAFIRPVKAEELADAAMVDQVTMRKVGVTCPEIMVATTGGRWTCDLESDDGSTGVVTISAKDRIGNISVDAPFLHVREAEATIAGRIAKDSGTTSVKVMCPDIVEAAKGVTFDCKVTTADGNATLAVTQTNARGGFVYEPKS